MGYQKIIPCKVVINEMMKEENKKDDLIITIFLLIVAAVCIASIIGYVSGTLEWLSNNFDKFFEPYVNIGIWFWVIVIVLPILYIWILFNPFGKKEDKNPEQR